VLAVLGLTFCVLAFDACGPRRYTIAIINETSPEPAPRRDAATTRPVESRDAARPVEDSRRGASALAPRSDSPAAALGSKPPQPLGMRGSSDVDDQPAGSAGGAGGRADTGDSAAVTNESQALEDQDRGMSSLSRWLLPVLVIGVAVLFTLMALGRVRS
jgi:hypothetical protein